MIPKKCTSKKFENVKILVVESFSESTEKLSAKKRSEIAKKATTARWRKEK
jgi:hypothetical protein